MSKSKGWLKWTLLNALVITLSYIISIIVLLLIHGLFGYSMAEEGTYLSNVLMHVGSAAVLAFGTGLLQKRLLKPYFPVSNSWVLALIAGFVLAELIAGIVLWKLEIYRGLINIFNTDVHYPEAMIFALAGLITGVIQFRLLKPYFKGRFYWILSSTIGWAACILFTYFGVPAFLLGVLFYSALTGYILCWQLRPK